jgi:hypothetical protein
MYRRTFPAGNADGAPYPLPERWCEMRNVEQQVYRYAELSEKAKARALGDYQYDAEYWGQDEALKSLQALAKAFGGKLADWSIDFTGAYLPPSSARFDMPEMDRDEIANILGTLGATDPETGKGLGDCKLTGYFIDESALDGFRLAFARGELDPEKLMQAAFDSWLEDCIADYESQLSEDVFSETADVNEWEFYADGSVYVARKVM